MNGGYPGGPLPETAAVGILGGAFDPVHHGHLRSALEVLETCGLSRVLLVPTGQPPHRPPPVAPAGTRLRMLRAAIASEPRLAIDDRETRRDGPSYTIDTLLSLRAELGGRALCLILGADAFLALESWHRWRELFALAHFIVMQRPGWSLRVEGDLAALLSERRTQEPGELKKPGGGSILVQEVTPLQISSSDIRARVGAGNDPRFLVPDPVRDLIATSGCYRKPAALAARSMEV